MKKKIQTVNDSSNSIISVRWDAVSLAVLSGLLLFLSFPKFGTGWLAWIAFLPLFFALKKASSVRNALVFGLITGVISYVGIIYWIAFVIVNYGNLPLHTGIALMLLLAFYLSVYISLFAGLVFYFQNKISLCFAAPVIWVCFEYLKSIVLTGFPWENLGYSQYLNIYLIQVADVTGVFGLSFLIILVNATLFELANKGTKKTFIFATVVFLIMAMVYVYGFYRLNQVENLMKTSRDMEVSLIQGNIDQSIKWSAQYQGETLNIYERLSIRNLPEEGSLIVWPETAVPFKFQDKGILQDQIINLARKTRSWLIFGSISSSRKEGASDYFNSAYILSPEGEIQGKYDKVHLVPYGEYVPLRKFFPFVNKLTAGIGDFGKGTGFLPISMGEKKIGVLICYEGILASAARSYKKNSADLLVNITNDAWFGNTSAPFQHFSMTVFRAIETRLFLVRAANTGISGIIDPGGRITARTNIFQEEALKGYVKYINMPTFYAKYGDLIVIASFLWLVFYLFLGFRRRL
jgi:apolipoprotein N-acyltransferase